MKKALAILMSAALLLGSLCCGIVMTSADEVTAPKFFFDFSTKNKYDDMVNKRDANYSRNGTTYIDDQEHVTDARTTVSPGSNNVISYDEKNSALEVATTTSTWMYLTLTSHDFQVDMSTHTVLAVKLKLTDKNAGFAWATMRAALNPSTTTGNGSAQKMKNYPSYAATTGWQLLLIDLSTSNWNDSMSGWVGNWYSTQLALDDASPDNPIYIQWAGIFTDTTAAQAYFNATTTAAEQAEATPSAFFYDYSTQAAYDKQGPSGTASASGVTSAGQATLSYDTDNAAMKVTASDNAPLLTWTKTSNLLKSDACNVFAVKIKLADTTSNFWYTWFSSTGAFGSTQDNFNKYTVKTVPQYDPVDDWQLMIINVDESNVEKDTGSVEDDGYWRVVKMGLDQGAMNKKGTYYIQWAGFFTDAANAQAYYASTTPVDSELTGLGAQVSDESAGGNDIRFGFQMAADGVDYNDGELGGTTVGYARQNPTATDMDNTAWMTIGGKLCQITDFGVMASIQQGITADALTVGAEQTNSLIQKVPAAKLYDVSGTTIQFYATLMDVPESFWTKDVSAVAYVEYKDGDTTKYIYSDMLVKSISTAQ